MHYKTTFTLTHEYFSVTVLPAAGVALDANFHVVTFKFLLGWLIFLPEDLKALSSCFSTHTSY